MGLLKQVLLRLRIVKPGERPMQRLEKLLSIPKKVAVIVDAR